MEFHPVTAERLSDLARFSERYGKFRWCSCMRWRLSSADFQRSTQEIRAAALNALVSAGVPVGVLGYLDGEPVAWCSIAPRETYAALERSRILPRIDDSPTWSVVCFFVDPRLRGHGVTRGLLQAAVDYARAQGAQVIEGYPAEPGNTYSWMGSPTTFTEVGFQDVPHPGHSRRIMRYVANAAE